MSLDVPAVVARIRSVAPQDSLAARLTLSSLVATLLAEQDHEIVLVGGTPVDAYAAGALGTSDALPAGWEESNDLDTVVLRLRGAPPRSDALATLEAHGFEVAPAGGAIEHPRLPFELDLVASYLDQDISQDHLVEVTREEWSDLGLQPVSMVGPEDLLLDYLESGLDTRHQRDWLRALTIAEVMGPHLDLGYLYTKVHWRLDGRFVEALDRVLAGEPLDDAPGAG